MSYDLMTVNGVNLRSNIVYGLKITGFWRQH